ncbi:MAG TPA: MarR family transcriptional regulator, partial [Actinomycetota bacterium]|nr:MarR family transcriptional regulator [Actinomycetota bacterium]
MEAIGTSGDLDAQRRRRRRRQVQAIKESLRALSNQLSVLNHQVSAHVEFKDVDLDCLKLVS